MNEIVREFLVESHENLAQLDLDLLALEKDPTERETLSRVFRTIHTVKGTAGFLGFEKLQAVSHAGESLLSRLRAGEIAFTADIANVLLQVVDAIRSMLASLEKNETEGDGDYTAIITRLETATSGTPTVVPRTLAAPPVAVPAVVTEPAQTEPPQPQREPQTVVSESSIRVDVGLLDQLMNLVGELVLSRNQLIRLGNDLEHGAIHDSLQRLNNLTGELQSSVMKTRLQPIGTLWSKFPRVVRDLAVACEKRVQLIMEGQDTELDRSIIEAIRDPLTHIVRNAIDHGIELPAMRQSRSKPLEGQLKLRAYHKSGKVVIEVSDDGGGIDPRRVREKAIAARLVARDHAERLDDRELLDFIFLPGFTTADRVTNFSGRGVGMDVVRTNIEKIGGTVTLLSEPQRGTQVTLTIPLTLAIIPTLIIACGGNRYAIPQVNLQEIICLQAHEIATRVETIHNAPVLRHRGSLLPLVMLERVLDVKSTRGKHSDWHIVVVQAESANFGLVIDELQDTEEIVVKPLQRIVKTTTLFAGATIMGDGDVALILDILGIAHATRVLRDESLHLQTHKTADKNETHEKTESILLFTLANDSPVAVSTSCVSRIEEFAVAGVEWVGSRPMIQYRDGILPLIDLCGRLDQHCQVLNKVKAKPLQVIVLSNTETTVGIIVDRVLDIFEVSISNATPANRVGMLSIVTINSRIVEVLDTDAVCEHQKRGTTHRLLTETAV